MKLRKSHQEIIESSEALEIEIEEKRQELSDLTEFEHETQTDKKVAIERLNQTNQRIEELKSDMESTDETVEKLTVELNEKKAKADEIYAGLSAITDTDKLYRTMRFAPRWAVTEHVEGRYLTGYEVSKRKVDVRWIFTDKGFRYRLECPSERVDAHLLVPAGKKPARLLLNGRAADFKTTDVFGSTYVDLTVAPEKGIADFEVFY